MSSLLRKITEENIWIYRTIVIAMLGILGFIGTWMFNSIASMPHTYVTVQAADKSHDDIKKSLEDRDAAMSNRLKSIDEKLDKLIFNHLPKG